MKHETSNLILLGDTARHTKEQDELITRLVKKSKKWGDDYTGVISMDASSLPKVVIKSTNPNGGLEDYEVILEGEPKKAILEIIEEYMSIGDTTILAYLSSDIKDWIALRAFSTWHNVDNLP